MHDRPATPPIQPDCPFCGGKTLAVSPLCPQCGKELPVPDEISSVAGASSEAKPWMDIDFGAPPPADPVATPAVAIAPPVAAQPPLPPAAFVEDAPGEPTREERNEIRQRVRLVVAAACGLLLLIAYFVLLALG